MSTPHIAAEKGDFAKTVLMPGDPYRSARSPPCERRARGARLYGAL